MGGILGFLRYNTHPARVFMGDSGSQFIGFTLAFLTILLTQKVHTELSPSVVLFLFGLPIADILVVFYLRSRQGMNLFRATRNHVHHRLLDLGFVHRESVIIIYSVQMIFVTTGIVLREQPDILLVLLYLIYCALLFGALYLAERTGWSKQRSGAEGESKVMTHEVLKNLLVVLPRRFMSVSIPLFLIGGSLLVTSVPRDFAIIAYLVSALIIIDLFSSKGQQSIMRRALIYILAAQVGYLWNEFSPTSILGGFTEAIEFMLFILLVIAFVAAVKFSPGRRKIEFEVTATDYLIVFCLLALLIVSNAGMFGTGWVIFVAQMIIIFYVCELLITEKRAGLSWLSLASLVTGIILGTRGMFLG